MTGEIYLDDIEGRHGLVPLKGKKFEDRFKVALLRSNC